MNRRDLLRLLAGTALTSPVLVTAQQPTLPLIGYLSARSPQDTGHLVDAFRRGLGEGGFVEGQNVTIEYRWALGQYDRLPSMAAELVRRPVSVVASTGGEPAVLAAKAATSTIPIVFTTGGDPVKQGLVASFSRPGGNATGISLRTNTLEPKRLRLLSELVPLATRFALRAMYHFREFVQAGGLVSYGIDAADAYRQVGVYVGRILRGTKPTDLPVMQASKFALVVNLKTAKALGLTIPQSWLQKADEIIQ